MAAEHLLENGDKITLSPYWEKPDESNPNLMRIRETNVLWVAEVPKDMPKDSYVQFSVKDNRVFTNSFFGYRCEIDIDTGKIISKEFVG